MIEHVERFWSKVAAAGPDDCWNWHGEISPWGYGHFWAGKRYHRAHRVAWFLTNGPIPHGLCVLHRCDNTKCCNPAHLFVGTMKDFGSLRICSTASHVSSALLFSSPQKLRYLCRPFLIMSSTLIYGYRHKLARRFGVSVAAIKNVLYGFNWRPSRNPNFLEDTRYNTTHKPIRVEYKGHQHVKLTWDAVAKIRAHPKLKPGLRLLAAEYGVSVATVKQVRRGKTWKSKPTAQAA